MGCTPVGCCSEFWQAIGISTATTERSPANAVFRFILFCFCLTIGIISFSGCKTEANTKTDRYFETERTLTPEQAQQREEKRKRYLEWKKKYIDPQGISENLEEDIKTMWAVAPKKGSDSWCAATLDAVPASERVFNTLNLIGFTSDEVAAKLHFELRSPDYGYNFPFWPIKKGTICIRIDNGNFGWQYNLALDSKGRVKAIERRWIH